MKNLTLLFALMLTFALTACGGGEEKKEEMSPAETPATTEAPAEAAPAEAAPADDGEAAPADGTTPAPK
jgi:hypothetical protein